MTEDDFLKDLFSKLPTGDSNLTVPNGDDTAAFRSTTGMHTLIACDQLIEGRHYLSDTPPKICGAKLLKRNLSDIAAMGGIPKYAVLSCNVNNDCPEQWLKDFHQGLLDCAQQYNVQLIGGDLASSPGPNAFSLTITGESSQPIQRSGAEDGDLLFATGEFGLSFPSEHHLHFTPRIKEGQFLANFAKAMIDLTDGLLLDSQRLLNASKQTLDLQLFKELIPPRSHHQELASFQEILTDGEDYELIFAIPANREIELQNSWPFETKLSKIGEFKKGTGKIYDNEHLLLDIHTNKGFDHFQS
ncbi:thiamine-phosphate kinase [Lentisphaera profundi]|uniref:Thiamine-monophosphate kinase n=1 Tax=Lentisphaera profundi TaxID=1658616 RepID=A0ABY7VWM1_9BACT|nr:thiamine-phosphate kinase [Lentisphaera profundi]WDE98122.1 thiamine-phosphate kinase [Lentisphaera profundi]